MTAATACRTCGTEPREGARFCDGCGAPVTAHDTHAEYKQVTVLFADVVHSMDIAAAVGAERLREIMAELADRCAAVVQRYGSTVTQWTGDGIMAVFGAPIALEDHAVRACLAALGVQQEAKRLAVDVRERDGIDLRLRVGLNSGEVIAGGIGSGQFGYATVGQQVGMAQRMESVAPPGGVMLSASTARLVEGAATLAEGELVRIKGAEVPVPARRLLGMADGHRAVGRAESNLVGRRWEMAAVEGLLERAIDGHGAVVGVVGSPGIGKSRLVREVTAMAAPAVSRCLPPSANHTPATSRFTSSHGCCAQPPASGGLDDSAARTEVRARVPDADPEDVLLVEDLLGIADPEVALAKIDPDARRRRLTALVNAASLARKNPGGLCRRGRALDRRGQRIPGCRLCDGDPADTLAGADHLSPRISGRVEPGARCAEHRPCAAERFGDRSIDLAAARVGPLGRRVGHHDRRKGRREPVLCRGDGARSGRAGCVDRQPVVIMSARSSIADADRAGDLAGHHRRPHRPARPRRQAAPCMRGGGHRVEVQCRAVGDARW